MESNSNKRSWEEAYCSSNNSDKNNMGRNDCKIESVWVCSRCTFHNHIDLCLCELCETPKSSKFPSLSDIPGDFVNSTIDTSTSLTGDLSLIPSTKKRSTWNSNKQNYKVSVEDVGSNKSQTVIEIDLDDNAHTDEQQANIKPPSRFLLSAVRDVLQEETRDFHLAYPYPHHITQINQYGSAWSCGYRNIQMLCSSLIQLPIYRQVLFNGKFAHLTNGEDAAQAIKDMKIPELQCWIQEAWQAGFDIAGGEEFGFSLIGKDDWIGTTECAALLRYFGIRAMVVDFHCQEVAPKKELQSQKRAIKKGDYQDDEDQENENEEDNVAFERFLRQEKHCAGNETTRILTGQTEERDQRRGENERRDLKDVQSLELHHMENRHNSQLETAYDRSGEYAEHVVEEDVLVVVGQEATTKESREGNEGRDNDKLEINKRQSQRRTTSCYSTANRHTKVTKKKTTIKTNSAEPLHNMGMRLANWIHRYFSHPWQFSSTNNTAKINITNKKISYSHGLGQEEEVAYHPPLYFQYMGHSRSIVGIEYVKDPISSTNNSTSTSIQSYFPSISSSSSGTVLLNPVNPHDTDAAQICSNEELTTEKRIEHLLLFDPISKSSVLHSHLLLNNVSHSMTKKSINKNWQRMIKKSPRSMRRYCAHQICYIAPGIMAKDSEEYQRSKIIRGILDDCTYWPIAF